MTPTFRHRLPQLVAALITVVGIQSSASCFVLAGDSAETARKPDIVVVLADDKCES